MKASDFYFQMSRDRDDTFFLITPKAYYDKEGGLSDESGVADEVVPTGFGEAMESTYEFDGNPEQGRLLLLAAGFKEIDFGFGAGEPSLNTGDETVEDFDDDEDEISRMLKDEHDNEPDPFDYKNIQTDKLIRHLKMMISTEAFEEAAKIKVELNSRNVIEF